MMEDQKGVKLLLYREKIGTTTIYWISIAYVKEMMRFFKRRKRERLWLGVGQVRRAA